MRIVAIFARTGETHVKTSAMRGTWVAGATVARIAGTSARTGAIVGKTIAIVAKIDAIDVTKPTLRATFGT